MDQVDAPIGAAGPRWGLLNSWRSVFWALVLLDVMLAVNVALQMYAGGGPAAGLGYFQPPILAWALAGTAYALFAWRRTKRTPARRDITDPATGLFTMDYLRKCLEVERQTSQEMGVSAAVVYLDLANLEQVNHRFGFTVGDIVLKALAGLIAAQIRSGDILGRVGGDEFLLVMPETTLAEAGPVTEAIQEAVSGYRLDLGKRGVIDFMECRAGAAVFPAEGGSVEEVAAAARSKIGSESELTTNAGIDAALRDRRVSAPVQA